MNDFKGFHESESYHNLFVPDINFDNIDSIITISKWDSYKDWNNWYYSDERNEIKEKYKDIIDNENIYVLKRNKSVFLL